MWQGSFRLAGRLVALALPLIASTASAAQLIPVLVDPSQNLITPGTAGQIGNALLYDRGVSTTGEPGPWPLGDYRMAISTANATMSASFEGQGLRMSTSASLRDEVMGDLRAPEANPQIGDTWFYVAAEAGEVLGEMVDFHLSLRWDSMATGGATIDSTATALLSNATNPRVARALTRKNDNVDAEVMIGEVYRVGLYHNNLVRDGLLVSSATLYAGLDTPPAMAAPAPFLAGDYNLDGIVNAADYTVWRDGLIKPYDFDLDGDGSGFIDAGDRDVFNAWYGTTVPGVNAVAIPEPATAVLLLAGLAMCRPRRI